MDFKFIYYLEGMGTLVRFSNYVDLIKNTRIDHNL